MPPKKLHTLHPNDTGNDSALLALFYGVPPVTRTVLLLFSVVTSIVALQLIPTGYLIYSWSDTFKHFQLWRILTSSLILPLQITNLLMELYNFYSRSIDLEQNRFLISSSTNPSIDYAYYIAVSMVSIAISSSLVVGRQYSFVLSSPFTTCITCTWAIDNANKKILYYGIIPVYGKYLPLIQLVTSFIFDQNGFYVCLTGLSTSYLFACLDTGSWGPIWGWLRGKQPNYGIAPAGKFGAPVWFIHLYQACFGEQEIYGVMRSDGYVKRNSKKKSTFKSTFASLTKGGGQRLGSLDETQGKKAENKDVTKKGKAGGVNKVEAEATTKLKRLSPTEEREKRVAALLQRRKLQEEEEKNKLEKEHRGTEILATAVETTNKEDVHSTKNSKKVPEEKK
ncbi:Dfm1p NDAI_0A04150 [Naumovozyma dairenensis CBS 421]|uniref:Derlin n=1 Tax=Naumovozyma dairenensis (strain ATCC 10597 / BCRC 20456 / CBS 421 / NBRC 0211 / NRRL Y-12639) TaxID=1071378 RepID=G0W434_NAUDC|nr:hypothetical protein NDAI_0A04150 [Naumovozyma dairenensis CBS 421]CCD22572.1 hypothetical protein NDAI_0A04150 [Naumovozyma dairenensis CBS 421]